MSLGLILFAGAVRVFSADYCADQLVLALADRDQIAALSVDADKDFSYLRGKADGLKKMRADAEAVYASGADVVLRYWGGDENRFSRLGVRVVTLAYASTFDDIRKNIETAADAIDQADRGGALSDELDRNLSALRDRGPSGVAALYVTPGGVTAGAHTMIDEIFSAAGVENIAAANGLSYWPPLSAEVLVKDPPAYVVAGFFGANSERINHWSAARHPALRKALDATTRVDLSADILACPNFFSVDAAEEIRKAVENARR